MATTGYSSEAAAAAASWEWNAQGNGQPPQPSSSVVLLPSFPPSSGSSGDAMVMMGKGRSARSVGRSVHCSIPD